MGVMKISTLDQVPAQCAPAGHVAFDDTRRRPPGSGFLLQFTNCGVTAIDPPASTRWPDPC
jgi:hypothetical protein